MADQYYKIAQPDGWDFFTGRTINYRAAIGGVIKHPTPNPAAGLCNNGVLHASPVADQCFVGGRIPCSLYLVEGTPVIPFDGEKAGFTEMHIIQELDPARHFKWRYAEAVKPLNPLTGSAVSPSSEDIALLKEWASLDTSTWWRTVRIATWRGISHSALGSVVEGVLDTTLKNVCGRARDYRRWGSRWGSAWRSVNESARAYVGYIFAPVIPIWKSQYPFMPAVKLWKRGLVPVFDGEKWRLHSGQEARVVWTGKVYVNDGS